MKFIFLALLTFPALACSELGPQEFKPTAEVLTKCGKFATQYALDFSKTMISIESKMKDYRGPKVLNVPPRGAPVLYQALAPKGGSKKIGYNVGLDGDKFECNFCVDFMLDGDNCRIVTITKSMCAN
jgi:hypothetical protein